MVQAYSFTSNEIAEALADAHAREVKIQIILDNSQLTARRSVATYTSGSGIPTFIDHAHAIAHNKVMIIDKVTVITGSFNFTKAAEVSNAENLLIVRSPVLAKIYQANWAEHRKHSEAYNGHLPIDAALNADLFWTYIGIYSTVVHTWPWGMSLSHKDAE